MCHSADGAVKVASRLLLKHGRGHHDLGSVIRCSLGTTDVSGVITLKIQVAGLSIGCGDDWITTIHLRGTGDTTLNWASGRDSVGTGDNLWGAMGPKAIVTAQASEATLSLVSSLVQAAVGVGVVKPALHCVTQKNHMGDAWFENAKQVNVSRWEQ
jgi:hypothetical protein